VFGYLVSDPESEIPFAQALYGNDTVMKTFYNSLSDDGILVMQLGKAPEWFNPDETHSKYKNRAATTSLLERVGFESIHVYEEVSAFCLSVHAVNDTFSSCYSTFTCDTIVSL
jgi:spermidine synthase